MSIKLLEDEPPIPRNTSWCAYGPASGTIRGEARAGVFGPGAAPYGGVKSV